MRLRQLRVVPLRARLAAVAACALVGGCGRGERAAGFQPLTWLELAPADPADAPPAPRLMAEFGPGAFGGFVLTEGISSIDAEPLGPNLHLVHPEPTSLRIPTELTPADFTRVTCLADVRWNGFVELRVMAGEEAVGRARTRLTSSGGDGPELVAFDLPHLPRDKTDPVELLWAFETRANLRLYQVQVHDVPAPTLFGNEHFEGFEPFELGGELRLARTLWQPAGLRAEFEPFEGQRLAFSFGVPDPFVERLGGATLIATLSAAGREPERRTFTSRTGAWRGVRLPLDGWVGERTAVTLELEARDRRHVGGDPPAAMLTRPRLERPSASPPAVLLVTSDTHRADHLAAAPYAVDVRTDALDRLAEQGVLFEDALASINNTTPSHVALMTGTSPRDTGVVQNSEGISSVPVTLADAFRSAGYMTVAAVSSIPVSQAYSGLAQGFEVYLEPDGPVRAGAETVERLLSGLDELDGLPVFAWVHVFDAHAPYEPPSEYERMYYSPDRDPYDGSLPGSRPELAPDWAPEIADPAFTEALYKGEVSHVDRLLDELFRHRRFRGAVIAFTADHGETLVRGDHAFDHRGLSPATLHVPLVLRAPGLGPGTRVVRPVRQIDVGRTLLNLCGLEEQDFPGEDLLAARPGSAVDRPRFALEANAKGAAVRSGRWMLRLALGKRAHSTALFDVDRDPYLERDLAADEQRTARGLRKLLVEWLEGAVPNPWARSAESSGEAVDETLAALGYATVEREVGSSAWFDPDCDCADCAAYR